jgi:hypothetical protein
MQSRSWVSTASVSRSNPSNSWVATAFCWFGVG